MTPTPPRLILLLLIGVFLAQEHPLKAQAQPDCSWTATFTADGNTTSHANLSSSNTPCVSWRITYSTTGTLASVIAFQTSPDNSSFTSVPNTICSSSVQPPCVTEGANPTASATVGNVAVRAYSAYTRVNVSGSSGTGTGSIAVYGYKGTSVNVLASGSGGGSGTVTSIATTAPITGGTITTTGTIACPTCTVLSGLTTNAVVAAASATTVATPSATTTLDSSGNLSAAGTVTATVKLVTPIIAPLADGIAALKINKQDGSTNVVDVDTTNSRVGIGSVAPGTELFVTSNTAAITNGFGTLTNSAIRAQTENATAAGTAAELQLGGRSTSGTLPIAALSATLETNTTGTGQIGALVFSTHTAVGDAALTERMRILANGTIGIGTSATSSTSSSLTLASNLAIGPAILGMASATTGAFDLGLSRVSAGVLGIGTGAAGAIDGALSNGLTTHTVNALGSTPADGLILINTTAAAAGAQQYSPRLRFTGQGWKTTATAGSQTVDWAVYNIPIQGAANPSSALYFTNQSNGGLYSTAGGLYLSALGNLSTTVPKIGLNGSQNTNTGFGSAANNHWNIIINGTDSVGYVAAKVAHNSTMEVGWTNGAPGNSPTIDTGFARNAAGTVEVNGGTIGTIAGGLFSREYGSGGTVPGISGCTAGTQTGGGTVGTFASGTTGVCTVTLTFAKTAPTGWYCIADNQTTFASFANIFTQTGGTTTTCVIAATTISGDVVKFAAFYY